MVDRHADAPGVSMLRGTGEVDVALVAGAGNLFDVGDDYEGMDRRAHSADCRNLDDAGLVGLAQAGRSDAFRILVERHREPAFAIAVRAVVRRDVAEDVTQEAFLRAYLGIGRIRDPASFGAWLHGVVINVCRDWRRRAKPTLLLDDWEHYAGGPDLEQAAEAAELGGFVQAALDDLPSGSRVAMRLFYLDDLPVAEVAARLGVSVQAVKSRLHKGRIAMRGRLLAIAPELPGGSGWLINKEAQMETVQTTIARIVLLVPGVLVLLRQVDDPTVLPLWLAPWEALSFSDRDEGATSRQPMRAGIALASDAIAALGAAVAAIELDELGDRLLGARIRLHGPAGSAEVRGRVGEALALARRYTAPVIVPRRLLERDGRRLSSVAAGKGNDAQLERLVDQLLIEAGIPRAASTEDTPRQPEASNLDFADALAGWELRGRFLQQRHRIEGAAQPSETVHWRDYVCGVDAEPDAGARSAWLRSEVPVPLGFADLRQGILADRFRGQRVRFSAEVRTVDVENEAGIYLRVVDPQRSRRPEDRAKAVLSGTVDWRAITAAMDVPADAVFVLFGLTLAGVGQAWLRKPNLELER